MNPEQDTSGVDWTNVINGVNEAALQWYSTVTQKPIATAPPPDFWSGLRIPVPQAGQLQIGGGTIVMLAAIVLGVALLVKR